MNLTKILFICIFFCENLLANDPQIQDPGLTLVDSVSLRCSQGVAEQKKCEFYLIYDVRDDVVFVIKAKDRKTYRNIQSILVDRSLVAQKAIKTIDLVKEFSTKKSSVKSYSAGFKKVGEDMKIRISLQFDEDQDQKQKPQDSDIQTEKLIDVQFYKSEAL